MAKAPHPSGWSTKRYILAALVGTITATAVVITVSYILRPAEISFSVTDALTVPPSGSKRSLSLTVTANNTSDRSGVQYRSLIVYLQFAQNGINSELPVGVKDPLPPIQAPGTTANISLSCSLSGTSLDSGGTPPMISILVLVVVRFKVGLAYSRPYEVRVSCGPVDFVGGQKNLRFPIACNA